MTHEWIAAALCLAAVYLAGIAYPALRLGRAIKFAAVALWSAGSAFEAFESALAAGLGGGVRAACATARETWADGIKEVV